jgi:hypothetical protein
VAETLQAGREPLSGLRSEVDRLAVIYDWSADLRRCIHLALSAAYDLGKARGASAR